MRKCKRQHSKPKILQKVAQRYVSCAGRLRLLPQCPILLAHAMVFIQGNKTGTVMFQITTTQRLRSAPRCTKDRNPRTTNHRSHEAVPSGGQCNTNSASLF
ncbi:unnamed protein product [Periconia digitata]|uniref:Uncharacterized protein n=1 Tax=Periconia digitata TaxID=1303443 RepID=A0A9W4UD36_9PLEO|nr:unnamed protein product [Periconia digitata]